MRFSEYMKKNIFEPLDMNNSYYPIHQNDVIILRNIYTEIQEYREHCRTSSKKKHTTGVVKRAYGNELVFGENYDSGGAGIITTVDDYAKFAAALANSRNRT